MESSPHVSFHETNHVGGQEVTSLDALLERNEIRTHLILNNPFFLLWRDSRLDDEGKRSTMLQSLAAVAETFGTALPPKHEPPRDDLARASNESFSTEDPVLRAVSTWHRHQMLTLDDLGKAALNIVLETVGCYLGALVAPVLSGNRDVGSETATERDARLRKASARLAGQHPDTYIRLHSVLEDAWDMLDEATTRIAALVTQER